ncbi:MAG: cobalamin transport system ATP-binding protein [Actinomycetota bacterium]|nr:cobalamin transport system ATP-binding protein [Actinomycetota bacterium]
MIELREVSVTFGTHRVVDRVSLTIAPGEWLNVVGPNGAGKTTLLRVLAGLATFDGTVSVGGRDSRTFKRREWARRVALVPQVPQIPPGISVAHYVLLGRTPHLRPLGAEGPVDLDAARTALARLDLLPFADRPVTTLSGGERQRVLIARLLAQDASIALLDEPTTALDVGHQQQVLDLIDELRRDHELTVIATMHDLTLAAQYGDRLALLDRGRLAATGTAAEVLTEASLSTLYSARVRVLHDGDSLVVVPVRARA